jgi:N-methylhydantoinase A
MILGIDVGGTHTDAVLIDGDRILEKAKVATNASDLIESLLKAAEALHVGEYVDRIKRVVLSTTISTNAIVQKKIDRVGIILSSGPGMAPQDLLGDRRAHIVSGSVNHRGIEVDPIRQEEIDRVGAELRDQGIRHLAVVGKFSTRNPGHELAIQKILGDGFRHVSLGHRMSGHLGFPRRMWTTYLNAAICDIYRSFEGAVRGLWGDVGRDIPIHILKADGGTCSLEKSVDYPVQTILSGPAASIMGVLSLSDCRTDAVALDIGGTTTDIAVLAGGVPILEPLGVQIGGLKTLIRGLRTHSIGVGGDSVVRFEKGTLTIGPGRDGPAAAFGGSGPTPTDAMAELGLISSGDRARASRSLQGLARDMRLTVKETAEYIYDQACSEIAATVRGMIEEINREPVYTIHDMLEGRRIEPSVLYVVGGPAAPMAKRLSELLGLPAHIPQHAEVANAVGAALARTTAEITVLADTEMEVMTVVEEGLQVKISPRFSRKEAHEICREKLRRLARDMGARDDDIDMDIVEDQEFNMVRGYYTTGKNIRVKAQIRPGLISNIRREEAGR